MEAKKSKTVFIEYSSTSKGQHFMTVVQNVDHQRIIIGRVYRDYDNEKKKSTYRAEDFAGTPIFTDVKDLYALKQKFIEHGYNLAIAVPANPNRVRPEKPIIIQKGERENTIKNIRENKTTKDKTKETTKANPKAKTNPDQKEKEQDSKNPTKYKDAEHGKEGDNLKENVQTHETAESNSEKSIQEESIEPEKSERDIELENIREDNEDREQEMDIDR